MSHEKVLFHPDETERSELEYEIIDLLSDADNAEKEARLFVEEAREYKGYMPTVLNLKHIRYCEHYAKAWRKKAKSLRRRAYVLQGKLRKMK